MDKVLYMCLAISHLSAMKQCSNSADNQLRYSFKLRKPGLCFNTNRVEDLVYPTEDLNTHKTEILRLYSSLFQTQHQISERQGTEVRDRLNRINIDSMHRQVEHIDEALLEGLEGTDPILSNIPVESIQTDLDVCCPTNHNHALYRELRNADNLTRYIVHFEDETDPRYQFVPEGSCISGPGGSLCSGQCFQEFRDHYLLVYDPAASQYPPVMFDRFRIKSYCSCKGVN